LVLFRSKYRGSSFFELLDVERPDLKPDFSGWVGSSGTSIPHGTTVLAFKFDEGVVVAGDRLATEGHRVASRDVEKVFSTDAYSLMAISGAAGPCIEMGRVLSVELEHYEKIEGESLELEGKANKLSQMIRANLPAAMQGLVVIPLFAGYDLRRKCGRLWKFDVTGGRYEETEYEATGSGGLFARESLKKTWNAGLSRSDAVAAAVTALTDAADQDRATGGVDLQRGIFPIVNIASDAGIERAPEAEIEEIYQGILAETRRAAPTGGIAR
jgi:proteasome beta subunit